jgi:hypothetical protein
MMCLVCSELNHSHTHCPHLRKALSQPDPAILASVPAETQPRAPRQSPAPRAAAAVANSVRPPTSQSSVACRDFQRNRCHRGDDCTFSHAAAQAAPVLNFGDFPRLSPPGAGAFVPPTSASAPFAEGQSRPAKRRLDGASAAAGSSSSSTSQVTPISAPTTASEALRKAAAAATRVGTSWGPVGNFTPTSVSSSLASPAAPAQEEHKSSDGAPSKPASSSAAAGIQQPASMDQDDDSPRPNSQVTSDLVRSTSVPPTTHS